MRENRLEEKTTYICNGCSCVSETGTSWYSFNMLNRNKRRIIEDSNKNFPSTSHIVDKKLYDFCSLDCARKFLRTDVDLFLAELRPISIKRHKATF